MMGVKFYVVCLPLNTCNYDWDGPLLAQLQGRWHARQTETTAAWHTALLQGKCSKAVCHATRWRHIHSRAEVVEHSEAFFCVCHMVPRQALRKGEGKGRKGKERKGKERKGKERKGCTFCRQFNEKPSIVPRAAQWVIACLAQQACMLC